MSMPSTSMPSTSMRTDSSRSSRRRRWSPLVRVEGRSMLPTLRPGRVLVTRPPVGRLRVGDVVVIAAPDGGRLVKRLAAGPGDVVRMGAGRLSVNGPPPSGAYIETWRVPSGQWFVVGDNVAESDDSRVWRQPFVPATAITGVALGLRRKASRPAAAPSGSRPRPIQARRADGRRLRETGGA
ncbi:signal peptidase I [Raineyella fluvialis]